MFAAALLHAPRVLVVDEPMIGLDPHSMRLVKDLMRQEVAAGMCIFMSTHTLQAAEEIANRVGIMSHGHLLFDGTIDMLRRAVSGRSAIFGIDVSRSHRNEWNDCESRGAMSAGSANEHCGFGDAASDSGADARGQLAGDVAELAKRRSRSAAAVAAAISNCADPTCPIVRGRPAANDLGGQR